MLDLRAFYIRTYADRFFTAQAPSWFFVYMWMEAGFHIPVSLWAVGGLWRGTLSPNDFLLFLFLKQGNGFRWLLLVATLCEDDIEEDSTGREGTRGFTPY